MGITAEVIKTIRPETKSFWYRIGQKAGRYRRKMDEEIIVMGITFIITTVMKRFGAGIAALIILRLLMTVIEYMGEKYGMEDATETIDIPPIIE